MANVEKSSIALTPEMGAIVRQCVESGEYASSGHVILEASRLPEANSLPVFDALLRHFIVDS